MDWDEEILGEMEGGYDNRRFSSYWNSDTNMTYPLILAKIPVKNPWEIFAYLPFGNWNECPDTPELMAVAKYWFRAAWGGARCHEPRRVGIPALGPHSRGEGHGGRHRAIWLLPGHSGSRPRMTPLWAIWRMSCGNPLFGTSGGIEQEDVSMNEYQKQYIELQKQFREKKRKSGQCTCALCVQRRIRAERRCTS